MYTWRPFILYPVAVLLGRVGAGIGVCDFGPRSLPASAEEFSRLAYELAGRSRSAEAQISQGDEDGDEAKRESVPLPEEPLVFEQVDTPSWLKGLKSEAAILEYFKETTWPRRGGKNFTENGEDVPLISVEEHFKNESNGNPLYMSHYSNDAKLQRIFQSVPHALRGVRGNPMAVIAGPSEGLQLHALPEPRWLLQLHGRSTWRLSRPEDEELKRRPPLQGCSPQFPQLAGSCELGPNSLIFVPANWGWSSCAESPSEGGESVSLAVGAGGYSAEWPELFHLIADGKSRAVKEQLEEDPSRAHVGDPVTSDTPMDLAAMIGNLKIAKLLQMYGGGPTDTADDTLLHALRYAIHYSHVDIVNWILEQGADPSGRAVEGGYTFLHSAAEAGHVPVVKALISARADLHRATKGSSASPAHLASGAGYLDVLKVLRDAGAELSALDKDGCDPTIWAAKSGEVPVLKFLLDDEGLSVDSRCDMRETSAHYAVIHGHTAILDVLKARKGNLAMKDDKKRTPLHVAVELGILPMIDWYGNAGLKKISPKTRGLLALAASRKKPDSLEALLRHGADVHALDPETKNLPIHFSRTGKHYDLFVQYGAKIPEGWVHKAARDGRIDRLKDVVEGRKELEALLSEQYNGVYPVHLAAQGGHHEVLAWICEDMGTSCDKKSSNETYGRTAVHAVCAGGSAKEEPKKSQERFEALKYLVQDLHLGADDKDDLGITPVELAGANGHLALVKYLLLEHKVDLEGIWQSKREGKLKAKVDRWVTDYAPISAYADWLLLSKPRREHPGPGMKPRQQGEGQKAGAQEL